MQTRENVITITAALQFDRVVHDNTPLYAAADALAMVERDCGVKLPDDAIIRVAFVGDDGKEQAIKIPAARARRAR